MNRSSRLALTLLVVGIMSMGMVNVPAQASFTATLTLMFPTLDTYTRSIADVITDNWYNLLVDVKHLQQPQPVILQNLFTEGRAKQWDIVVFATESQNKNYPELYNRYSNRTRFGSLVYNLNDSALLEKSGVDYVEFQNLVDSIHYEFDPVKRKELTDTFQQKMMEEWLIELPLLEQTQTYAIRNGFEGMDNLEGLLGSIMRGAKWESMSSERKNAGFGEDIFQTFITNEIGGMNPIIASHPEIADLQSYLFPSLFLVDKNGNLHPNLVKQFSYTVENGSSVWDLTLYDNVYWRERDGSYNTKVTASDIKFTLDLRSAKWSQFAGSAPWNTGFDIEIIDDFNLKLSFPNASPVDIAAIASEKFIPEHVLNGTLEDPDGNVLGELYSGEFNPTTSKQWRDFSVSPITAGPYYFAEKLETDYVLKQDPRFIFPNEADTENFYLNTPEPEEPYYFAYADDPATSTFEKPTELFIKERRFILSEQQTTTFLQFKSGIGDLVTFYNAKDFSGIKESISDVSIEQFAIPGSGVMLIFNLYNSFLQNLEVRKALYYALDRGFMSKFTTFNQQLLNSTINSYYKDFYNGSWGYEYDFQKAKDIFESFNFPVIDKDSNLNRAPFPFFVAVVAVLVLTRRRR